MNQYSSNSIEFYKDHIRQLEQQNAELLEALKDAQGTLESIIDEMGNVMDFDDLIATNSNAEQAIAKAEGVE